MNKSIKSLVRSGLLLAIAIVFQAIGKNFPGINQFLVGPVINAILLIGTFMCGIWWGTAIGILTPLTAWMLGQLTSPLGPFVPFIMAGNAIFVICFGLLKNKGQWGKYAGILSGAFIKYLFLYFSATKLIHLFKLKLPAKIAVVMGIPQLITALIGGAIAIVLIEMLLKRKIDVE
jgi:hypothetical protein